MSLPYGSVTPGAQSLPAGEGGAGGRERATRAAKGLPGRPEGQACTANVPANARQAQAVRARGSHGRPFRPKRSEGRKGAAQGWALAEEPEADEAESYFPYVEHSDAEG